MKKLFLKLTDSKSRYCIFENAKTKNFLLTANHILDFFLDEIERRIYFLY